MTPTVTLVATKARSGPDGASGTSLAYPSAKRGAEHGPAQPTAIGLPSSVASGIRAATSVSAHHRQVLRRVRGGRAELGPHNDRGDNDRGDRGRGGRDADQGRHPRARRIVSFRSRSRSRSRVEGARAHVAVGTCRAVGGDSEQRGVVVEGHGHFAPGEAVVHLWKGPSVVAYVASRMSRPSMLAPVKLVPRMSAL